MNTLKAISWFLFAIDVSALLLLLHWALTASGRDGEFAYAVVFLLVVMSWLAISGGALLWSSRQRSRVGLWCSLLLLGLPPVIAVMIRISNSL
jgi:hypothetical protein